LHDTPELAADAIAGAYSNVEKWWNDSERRQVIQDFCRWAARTSPDDSKRWSSFFNMISKDHPSRDFSELRNILARIFSNESRFL